MIKTIALLAIALALASCAGLGLDQVFQRPRVQVEDATVNRVSFEQLDLVLDFLVENPNGVSLPLSGIDYELFVNGERFAEGLREERIDIPARGEGRVDLPVSLRFEELYRAFRSLRESDRSEYELRADFLFDVPVVGRVTVPVSKRGDLPLLSQLGASRGQVRR